jgi:type IV pilus assembly protein PilW
MKTPRQRRYLAGVGLIELMVALAIGLFLILGAVTVLNQSRNTSRTAEKVARLQETARLALEILEDDLRQSNFWGMSNRADYIVNRAPLGASPPADFNATQRANSAVCGSVAASNYFVLNLDEYVGGANNAYGLPGAACAATDYRAGTDTLWLRRASTARPDPLDPDRIHLQTSRIRGTVFVPAAACTDPQDIACVPADYQPPASQSRALEVHVYYVSASSINRADVPALRRKRLANVNDAGGAPFVDEELVPGVENLQVRFGVDTNGDSNADQYVDPGAVPAGATVVSATVWLLVRAEDVEQGYVNDTPYGLAGAAAVTFNDGFRRLLLTRTIHIRNTRA